MKKIICCVLVLCLLTGMLNVGVFAEDGDPKDIRDKYVNKAFGHISDGYNFGNYIADMLFMGIEKLGAQNATESGAELTRVEAMVIAARLHSFYSGKELAQTESKPWFKVYLDYGHTNGIVPSGQTGLNDPVSRKEFASLLSKALPAKALGITGEVLDGTLVDVNMGDPFAEGIYRMCRAGVFTDVDEKGNFRPEETVLRGDVDEILARIAIPGLRCKYDFKAYVGSTAPMQPVADDEFFSDACIIGNSLVEGIRMYSGLNKLTYYSTTGMTVYSAAGKYGFYSRKGTYETAAGAAAKGDFSKVYIELGINEIGLEVDKFIAYYSNIISILQDGLPEADIYILSLTPVSKKKDSGGIFTMESINAYNEGLKRLAIEKGCYYLDCVSSMVDETGFLPSGDTWDGVHFNIPKYAQWEEIIRTHYAN